MSGWSDFAVGQAAGAVAEICAPHWPRGSAEAAEALRLALEDGRRSAENGHGWTLETIARLEGASLRAALAQDGGPKQEEPSPARAARRI